MTPDLNELERLLKDYEESTRRLGQSNFCNQAENLSKAIYAEQRVKTVAVNALPGLIERVREAEKDARRFAFYVGDHPKSPDFTNKYLKGIREHWTIDQWRNLCDMEMEQAK